MRPAEIPPGLRDLALERQRLNQQLNWRGQYDPAGLAQLAAICLEMHDLFHAGRLWLFSDVTDASAAAPVERIVDYFADRCGRKPRSILSQIPSHVLCVDFPSYPAVVRERLARIGLTEADIRKRAVALSDSPIGVFGTIAPMLVVGYGVICMILGAIASIWLVYRLFTWLL